MDKLVDVLMRRDSLNRADAMKLIREARADLHKRLSEGEGVDDQDFMEEWFGLEPDYVIELL